MTRFIGGPANGRTMLLRRAPVLLRVVVDRDNGNVDALDQLEDMPEDHEAVHAYELTGPPSWCFVDGTNVRGRFVMAEYRLCEKQPEEAEMRNMAAWAWWTDCAGPQVPWVKERLKRQQNQ